MDTGSTQHPDDRPTYLNVGEVADMIDVSIDTIWRWTRNGSFPAPIKLGARTTRWTLSEIQNWAASRNIPDAG